MFYNAVYSNDGHLLKCLLFLSNAKELLNAPIDKRFGLHYFGKCISLKMHQALLSLANAGK